MQYCAVDSRQQVLPIKEGELAPPVEQRLLQIRERAFDEVEVNPRLSLAKTRDRQRQMKRSDRRVAPDREPPVDVLAQAARTGTEFGQRGQHLAPVGHDLLPGRRQTSTAP
jgi:hypothetical protein